MSEIFVSVPIMDRPEFKFISTLYQSMMTNPGTTVRLYVNEGDSLISRVRNVHMSIFYYDYPECEYFISLDSDLEIVNAFDTNNVFKKLLSHDLDFVGGLYSTKKVGGQCSSVAEDMRSKFEFDSGLAKMRWLSTGCWCIKRSVVTKMIEAYPELTYDGDDYAAGKIIHALYQPIIHEDKDVLTGEIYRKYLSEDWAFCRRWKDIGGEIYADTSIVLKHIGKTPYSLWNVEPTIQQGPEPPKPGHDLENKSE